jgi:DNA polymerase-3 subunit gamma/tau
MQNRIEEGTRADTEAPLLPAGGGSASASSTPYRVLARKYRPSSFDDLIGQEAMVKTLSNAFDLGRIHQAYILTGVRGVGKTTTARILARAFNYELPAKDGRPAITGPTIHMPELGVHCQAIIESRHVDVIEMDAASHTGIDDIREIIDSARYKPMVARTKVYIIDEVHMLSKQAFNGLLKTLEEPPDHVKFLFATTEIDKVPVTVRSRCQRFDLRRIDADVLIAYLGGIGAKENVTIEREALALIARAAEGSVRDALSLLDQAIAHAGGGSTLEIGAEAVRNMLGLADHAAIVDLFESVMRGRIAAALKSLKELYDQGADPAQILADLAEFVHLITRVKIVPEAAENSAITPYERTKALEMASGLSMPVLTRTWQLVLKGLEEVKDSPFALAAADMVLVRLAYAADLPTPDEALRKLADSPSSPPGGLALGQNSPSPRPEPSGRARSALAAVPIEQSASAPQVLASFEDVVALAGEKRDLKIKHALECDIRLVRFAENVIEIALQPGASPQIAHTLMARLKDWTGQRWVVAVSGEAGAPSLKEQAEQRARENMDDIRADPLVQRALAAFPGAEIVAVRLTPPPDAAQGTGEDKNPGDFSEDIAFIADEMDDGDL